MIHRADYPTNRLTIRLIIHLSSPLTIQRRRERWMFRWLRFVLLMSNPFICTYVTAVPAFCLPPPVSHRIICFPVVTFRIAASPSLSLSALSMRGSCLGRLVMSRLYLLKFVMMFVIYGLLPWLCHSVVVRYGGGCIGTEVGDWRQECHCRSGRRAEAFDRSYCRRFLALYVSHSR